MSVASKHDHQDLMDSVYQYQRHIYDLTRKYYLFGRDHLIEDLMPDSGSKVLEIACGTGRNLAVAAKRYPKVKFYGFDISEEMLKSAEATIQRSDLQDRVTLKQGDATVFDPDDMFGEQQFDRIFISYGISMIPVWKEALHHASNFLAPGGSLHVVDFGQQEEMPAWTRSILGWWLAKFHVTARSDFDEIMQDVAEKLEASCVVQQLYRDYARYAVVRRK